MSAAAVRRKHFLSLSSHNVKADLWPVCVFAQEILELGETGCRRNKVIERTSVGDRGCFLILDHCLTFESLED